MNDFFELFIDGGIGDGRFDGRGVRRSRSLTIHVGSVLRRVRASWGGIGRDDVHEASLVSGGGVDGADTKV